MIRYKLYIIITYFISLVWLINGLICKVLSLVPRHQEIIGEILGHSHARLLALLIGSSEIIMAIWVLSSFKPKFNAITQITIIASMNLLEHILVPELLLWGKLNSFFAFLFILLIAFNEFFLRRKSKKPQYEKA